VSRRFSLRRLRSRDSGTGGIHRRDADVTLKTGLAGRGEVHDVEPPHVGPCVGGLNGRIPDDGVSADRRRSRPGHHDDALRVTSDEVFVYDVTGSGADDPDPEVVRGI
jgi:hypothetical protein